MRQAHYTVEQIIKALRWLGIKEGDVLFSHSNIGFFGAPEGRGDLAADACKAFERAFREVLGPEGTLAVPTFTYSFPRGLEFDPELTPGDCGIFTEFIRKLPDSRRSRHPCISVAAIGGRAEELTADMPENGYGEGSFFDRFYRLGGKICNLNFDAGSTFVHYVERRLGVPYRFDKTFKGSMIERQKRVQASCTIWVRHMSDDNLEAAFEPFDKLARDSGAFRTHELGRGGIGAISASDTYDLISKTLPSRPFLLTRAEALGIKDVRLPEGSLRRDGRGIKYV